MKFSTLLISLLLVGCAYRWEPDFPEGIRPTVSIPFVAGDEDGFLTREVARSLTQSGLADVVSSGGDYQLQIAIVGEQTDKIGFRVDPQKVDGKVRNNLLTVEERRSMTVEATLQKGDEIIGGPYRMTADAEYDFVDGDSIQDLTFTNPSGNVVTVLPFSLGQLESVESAAHAATTPLYKRLAQKIVDAISSEW